MTDNRAMPLFYFIVVLRMILRERQQVKEKCKINKYHNVQTLVDTEV